MFCSNCGSQLPESSVFCAQCGASQVPKSEACRHQSQRAAAGSSFAGEGDVKDKLRYTLGRITGEDFAGAPAPEYQRYPHPYHKLGGWLAFITYAQLIAMILVVIAVVVTFFLILRAASYFGGFLGFGGIGGFLIVISLIEIAVLVLCVFIAVKFFTMIKSKNPRFLRFYELMCVIFVAMEVIVLIFSGLSYYLDAGDSIQSIISSLIGFFIWTTYFRKSVRVRTYMGSDEYLRRSIFFKNAIAPAPADTRPYEAYSQPSAGQAQAGGAYSAYTPGARGAAEGAGGSFCPACGSEFSDGAAFCATCGRRR